MTVTAAPRLRAYLRTMMFWFPNSFLRHTK